MLIAGSDADTLSFSQDAFERAAEPKELMLVDGASHLDLYYKDETCRASP